MSNDITNEMDNTNQLGQLSDIAKNLGIRISAPHGYYPEDVDNILTEKLNLISDLQSENTQLKEELADVKDKKKRIEDELTSLKMQVSLMDVPDLSTEEEFAMLGQMDSITGNYNSESVQQLKDDKNIKMKSTNPKGKKLKINIS